MQTTLKHVIITNFVAMQIGDGVFQVLVERLQNLAAIDGNEQK